MINNCHIEQQLYLVYLPRWHTKIYNPAKMSQYLQTSWIPGLLAIPGLTDTVAPLFYNWHYSCFARMSTSPSMSLFETIHFLTELWQVVTLSPYWWLLWYQVQLLLSYTAPCHLHTILWTGHVVITQAAQAHWCYIEYDFTIKPLLLQLIELGLT